MWNQQAILAKHFQTSENYLVFDGNHAAATQTMLHPGINDSWETFCYQCRQLLEACKTFLGTSHGKRLLENEILLAWLHERKAFVFYLQTTVSFSVAYSPGSILIVKSGRGRRNDLALKMFVLILAFFRFSHVLPQQFILTAKLRLLLLIFLTEIWSKCRHRFRYRLWLITRKRGWASAARRVLLSNIEDTRRTISYLRWRQRTCASCCPLPRAMLLEV